MKNCRIILVISCATFSTAGAFAVGAIGAGQSTSTVQSTSLSKIRSLQPSNDRPLDASNVTDGKLKAESGSLSRYSMKFSLSYSGPPIGDLENKMQPNPDGSIGNYSTFLGGAMSLRYRLDRERALSMGSGLNALAPLHGFTRLDLRTPFFAYDTVFRQNDWQVRSSPGVSLTTIPEYQAVGQYSTLNYDFSVLKSFTDSKFRIGLESGLSLFLYGRSYERRDGRAGRYNLGFYPLVKYSVSDRLSVLTSLNRTFWNARSNANNWAIWNRTLSQRVGFEYSITREIYLAPYLNFYPEDLNLKSTTINVATIFSLL